MCEDVVLAFHYFLPLSPSWTPTPFPASYLNLIHRIMSDFTGMLQSIVQDILMDKESVEFKAWS